MKKFMLIFFACCLIYLNIFGQDGSGEITYKVMLIEEMENPLDTVKKASADAKSFVSHYKKQRAKMLPYFEYNLVFNKEEALLFYPEKMSSDDSDVEIKDVAMFVGLYDQFYFNLNQDEIRNQRRFFHDEIILVTSKISEINWEILPETKVIAGYECQKATTDEYDLIEDSYIEDKITVWFAKEIPFPFGPGLAGLPGMILGVETKRMYIYADDINLHNKEKNITVPTKGRTMTGNEFQEELEESFRKMEEGNWDWDKE